MLLAIDPGTIHGWALYDGGRLVACGVRNGSISELVTRVVIEVPTIYPGGRTKNPNNVLSVAVAAGEWGGLARARGLTPEYVTPSEWKGGNVPKKIQDARDEIKLSPAEATVFCDAAQRMVKGDREHMRDAIGIGLKALGR